MDRFDFANLKQLRDWLNDFHKIDLEVVFPKDSDWITLDWYEEKLTDGSIVHNINISSK